MTSVIACFHWTRRLNISFRPLAIKVLKLLVCLYLKVAAQLAINVGCIVPYVNTIQHENWLEAMNGAESAFSRSTEVVTLCSGTDEPEVKMQLF